MTDLQAQIDAGGLVSIPEGITQITASVRLRPGSTLRGAGRGLSVVEVLAPGIDALICDSGAPTEAPTRCEISGLTVRTVQTGVTGVRGNGASANTFRDLGFQGPEHTLLVDRGLHNVIDTIYAEEFQGRPVGTLLVGSLDGVQYANYVTIRAYQTRGAAGAEVAIFCRAANVSAEFMLHAPGGDGILITDDCQGLMLSGFVVAANNGVVLSAIDPSRPTERRPSFVDMTRLQVDQSRGFGVVLDACTDVDLPWAITNGVQGILHGGYPSVERIKIPTRLAEHKDNGIVIEPGARFWSVVGASACGTGGAALVVSNLDGDDFSIVGCDFSQGNGQKYVGPAPSPTRVVVGNR